MPNHPRHATEIDFDERNEAELAGHGVTPMEAYEVLTNEPAWAANKKGRAGLWLAIGRTYGGRALTLPVSYDVERNRVRPITGWDSSRAERTKYLGVDHG